MNIRPIATPEQTGITLDNLEVVTYDHRLGVPQDERSDALIVGLLTDVSFTSQDKVSIATAEAGFRSHRTLQELLKRTSLELVPVSLGQERVGVSAEYTIDHQYGHNVVLVNVEDEAERSLRVGAFVGQVLMSRVNEALDLYRYSGERMTKAQLVVGAQANLRQ